MCGKSKGVWKFGAERRRKEETSFLYSAHVAVFGTGVGGDRCMIWGFPAKKRNIASFSLPRISTVKDIWGTGFQNPDVTHKNPLMPTTPEWGKKRSWRWQFKSCGYGGWRDWLGGDTFLPIFGGGGAKTSFPPSRGHARDFSLDGA